MKSILLVSVLAGSAYFVASTEAGLLVGTASNITWNRGAAPAGSPTITIPIRFDGGVGQSSLQAFTLGLKFSGGSGTLAISNPVNPATTPLFPTQAAGLPSVGVLGGGVTGVSAENNAFANVAPGTTGLNAVTFNFTSTNAFGIFSLLYDATLSSFFVAPGTGDQVFGNADNFQIATITVSGAEAPEPAFLGILVMSPMLGAMAMRWRRRRRASKASTDVVVSAS